jgi:transposase
MIVVYTQFFALRYMIGVSSIMDSLLEEQRSIINFLVAEGEKPCHIFQRLTKIFSDKCVSRSTFYNWVSQFREDRTNVCDRPRTGRPAEAVTPNNGSKC